MKKLSLFASLLATLPAVAMAATLTLPSVTISSAASTSITCNPVNSPFSAPLAVGTVVFDCAVTPSTWTGAVSLSGSQFVVAGLSGASFNVTVGPSALAAGSYVPGVLTTAP